MNRMSRAALLSIALLLGGCKVGLYSNLSEVDANQMLALLASNQIDASKTLDKSGGLTLQVEKSDFVKAVEILRQNGFPRRAYRSVEELFPSGQLVTSPSQEQAKIQFLREQSLERMLGNIEGVISANAVISSLPDGDEKSGAAPSVSVLVKYTPEVNLKAFSAQIRNLIANALPGVQKERISLIVQPVNYRFASSMQALPDDAPPVLPAATLSQGAPGPVVQRAQSAKKTMLSTAQRLSAWRWPLVGGLWLAAGVAVWYERRKSRNRAYGQ